MSKLNDLLDEIVRVQATIKAPVVKRMVPKFEEEVDQVEQTTVSGAEQVELCTRIGFGGKWRIVYKVEITLITPNNRDLLKFLPEHAEWREQTRRTHESVIGAAGCEVINSPMLSRNKLAQGFNYNQVVLILTTYEARP